MYGDSKMSSTTVKLKLNESQELKFKLHVQGTTSEPGAQNPQFRFVLTEKDGDGKGLGLVFPVRKEENGTVAVCIPSMDEGLIKENKYYVGKMEVLMGSRYFTPTVLDIQFEREFKITAEAIVQKAPASSAQASLNEQQATVTSEYVSVVSSAPQQQHQQPQVHVQPKFKITAEDIRNSHGSETQLKAIIAEKVAQQIPRNSSEFLPYVESAFKKVRAMIKEAQTHATPSSSSTKTVPLLERKEKLSVEELMSIVTNSKNK